MEQPNQFRASFNGFNREDVVRYMEYINSKHAAQVAQLTNELEYLRGKRRRWTQTASPSGAGFRHRADGKREPKGTK